MSALPYLRIKNWAKLQHYSDRRPPWIKAYQGLLGDDQDFAYLAEFTQWQLMRIWILASRSSLVTMEDGRPVPVVVNDAQTLQRSVMTLKKIPLGKLIADGWLIPVAEEDVFAFFEAKGKRKRASTVLAQTPPEPDPVLAPLLEVREVQEKDQVLLAMDSGRQFEDEGLPIENQLLVARLMQLVGNHADKGTRHIVRSHASKLPPASLAKVIESLGLHKDIRDRAAYAVGALSDELAERESAA